MLERNACAQREKGMERERERESGREKTKDLGAPLSAVLKICRDLNET